MESTNEKINREIWGQRKKKIKILALLTVVFSLFCVFFVLPQLTTGDGKEEFAYVESVGFSHGANGGSVYLVCRLENGKTVRVFIYDNQAVKEGDQVVLRGDERLIGIGEKRYSFLRLATVDNKVGIK